MRRILQKIAEIYLLELLTLQNVLRLQLWSGKVKEVSKSYLHIFPTWKVSLVTLRGADTNCIAAP